MHSDGGDYSYLRPELPEPPDLDCRTADQKLAAQIADLQAAVRMLVTEIERLREEMAELRKLAVHR